MVALFNRFSIDERGATATEYAMLIVFIALAVAVGATAIGADLNTLYNTVATTVTGVVIPNP